MIAYLSEHIEGLIAICVMIAIIPLGTLWYMGEHKTAGEMLATLLITLSATFLGVFLAFAVAKQNENINDIKVLKPLLINARVALDQVKGILELKKPNNINEIKFYFLGNLELSNPYAQIDRLLANDIFIKHFGFESYQLIQQRHSMISYINMIRRAEGDALKENIRDFLFNANNTVNLLLSMQNLIDGYLTKKEFEEKAIELSTSTATFERKIDNSISHDVEKKNSK